MENQNFLNPLINLQRSLLKLMKFEVKNGYSNMAYVRIVKICKCHSVTMKLELYRLLMTLLLMTTSVFSNSNDGPNIANLKMVKKSKIHSISMKIKLNKSLMSLFLIIKYGVKIVTKYKYHPFSMKFPLHRFSMAF